MSHAGFSQKQKPPGADNKIVVVAAAIVILTVLVVFIATTDTPAEDNPKPPSTSTTNRQIVNPQPSQTRFFESKLCNTIEECMSKGVAERDKKYCLEIPQTPAERNKARGDCLAKVEYFLNRK